MPFPTLFNGERSRIMPCKTENVSTIEFAKSTGSRKRTILRLVAAAWDLLPNTVHAQEMSFGRQRKTSKAMNTLLRRQVMKNPDITANEFKIMHPSLLGNIVAEQHSYNQQHMNSPALLEARTTVVISNNKFLLYTEYKCFPMYSNMNENIRTLISVNDY